LIVEHHLEFVIQLSRSKEYKFISRFADNFRIRLESDFQRKRHFSTSEPGRILQSLTLLFCKKNFGIASFMVQISALRQAVFNRINDLSVSRSVHNLRQNLKSDPGNSPLEAKKSPDSRVFVGTGRKIDLCFSLGKSARPPQTRIFDPDLTTA